MTGTVTRMDFDGTGRGIDTRIDHLVVVTHENEREWLSGGSMTNKGKTYQRRGGRPPRLRQALEVAWAGYQAALVSKGKQRLPTPDEWFIQATLIAAQQHQDRVKVRQGYAPVESGTVTRERTPAEFEAEINRIHEAIHADPSRRNLG